jgi:serine/threonine-protein kinase OSR1/STK39
MRSLNHANLLPLLCSFVEGQHLWMVMPYVHGGSVLNIMRYQFPEGLEEPVIATIMKDVLRALDYLHRHGVIHRDVKAGNILLDSNGQVLLADFGVAATLERGGSWGNRATSRNTFVGTPCWMAPEVMEQSAGYDARADIWSFGITLLELAHGHAPFARLPPMKVLLMTLQNPPPTLDHPDAKRHFSKAMRDIVAKCLVKDPTQRPTAAQLLDHKFFKTAHDAAYLQRHVLENLPSAPRRMEVLRQQHGGGGAGRNEAQEKEILASQQEYRRGVSAWDFDVAALKAAAAAGAAAEEAVAAGRLPIISEASDASEHGGASGAGPPPGDAASGPPSPSKLLTSPTAAAAAAARAGGATPGRLVRPGGSIKEQGRFKVYEGDDEPPPFSPPPANGGAALMEDAMRGRSGTPPPPPAAGGDDPEGAKRKGRFRYVEEDFGADGKARAAQ